MIDNTPVELCLGSIALLKAATDTLLAYLRKANIQVEEVWPGTSFFVVPSAWEIDFDWIA